ncbi:MAG: alpha/beta hydrolase, partial [Tagaea sp.]|nr:alpha/beta hydrolase [Tagaea sp.]
MAANAIPGVEIVFEIDGIRVTARANGIAGRPKLFVLPGAYGEAARLAPSLAQAFGDSFDWLCPDMPASRETADFGDPGIANVARILARVARAHFGDAVYGILGASMGGIVAAHIARENPGRVAAIAIDDPAVRTAQQWRVREVVVGLYRAMPAGRWRDGYQDYARRVLGFCPASGALFALDHGDAFSGLKAPLLVVAGDEPLLPKRESEKSVSSFDADGEGALRAAYSGPFLSIVRIAGLGHSCLFAAPDVCGPFFLDFFARHAPDAAGLAPGESALAARGLARAKAGDMSGAYRDFLRVAALRPDDPGAAWFAGAIALQAGDPRAAIGPLARACATPAADPERLRALETALRSAPAGTYDAYRHALRTAIAAHRGD